ncbi:MAG: hypothetical protein GY847_01815 [Proteobacteria bacterium]|nr:hypothetical protein [Pseudomonadota bacterium]
METIKGAVFGMIKAVKGNKFSAYASTRSVDRDREVILPEAFGNLDAFMENPVLLQYHNYREAPAGKITQIGMDQKGIPFQGEFAPTEDGKLMRTLYSGKFMNAFSVGFIARSWQDIDPETSDELYTFSTPNGQVELNMAEYKTRPRRVFTDVELLEVSCVPVPANADALQRMQTLSSKMLDDLTVEDTLKELELPSSQSEKEEEAPSEAPEEEKELEAEAPESAPEEEKEEEAPEIKEETPEAEAPEEEKEAEAPDMVTRSELDTTIDEIRAYFDEKFAEAKETIREIKALIELASEKDIEIVLPAEPEPEPEKNYSEELKQIAETIAEVAATL